MDTIKPAHHGWEHIQGGEDPIPTLPQGPGGQGFAASLPLPVLELAYQSNNFVSSRTPTWTINSSYAFNGYMEMSVQNDYVIWPVFLAPKGSVWLPYAVLAEGSDFGIVTWSLGSALPLSAGDDTDGLNGDGLYYDATNTTFVTMSTGATFDCYNATPAPFPGSSQIFGGFRVMGDDGTIGTSFSGSTAFAAHAWDGGSGPHFLKLQVSTKNASSTGYRWRISALGMMRTDWEGLF